MLMPCRAQPVTVGVTQQMKMDFCWRKERSPWNKSPSRSRPWSTGLSFCHPLLNIHHHQVKWTCLNIHLETHPHPSSMQRLIVWTVKWELEAPCLRCLRFRLAPVLSPTMPPLCQVGICQLIQTQVVEGVVHQSTLKMCTTHQISIMWFKGLSPREVQNGIIVQGDTILGVSGQSLAWMLHGALQRTSSVGHVTVIRSREAPCHSFRTIRLFHIVKMTISSCMNRSKDHRVHTICLRVTQDFMCMETEVNVWSILVNLVWLSPALLCIIIISKFIIKHSLNFGEQIGTINFRNVHLMDNSMKNFAFQFKH